MASPTYLSRYGRPQHPHDLGAHQCLTYANRSKRDVWRFTHKNGEECPVTPTGALRGTSVEALLPTVLAGLAITELPEFIATQYFPGKQLEPILTDWRLPEGGLYFVTPSARANRIALPFVRSPVAHARMKPSGSSRRTSASRPEWINGRSS